jgi:hypothetical protein
LQPSPNGIVHAVFPNAAEHFGEGRILSRFDFYALNEAFTVNSEQVFYRSRREHLLDSCRLVFTMNVADVGIGLMV